MDPVFIESKFRDKKVGEYCEQRWLEWKKIIKNDPQAGLNLYNRRNQTCKYNMTYMHYVCRFGTYGEFVKVVHPLKKTQKLTLFKQQDNAQYTPLMCLIINNPMRRSSAIVKSLQLFFSELSHDKKLDMLLIKEFRGWNALAYAAYYNCVSAIEFLLNAMKFDPLQQLKLMKFYWRFESDTASLGGESRYGSDEEAGVKKPVSASEVAHYYNRKESSELLERLKVDAMIRVAVETKSSELRQKRVEEISFYESMTLDQVEELSSQSNQYILPRNQTKSRKHALICYTTDNREGAIKEAKILEESMEMLDHEITILPWISAERFEQDFQNSLERIKTTCCFLTLCVMAHGSPGAVRGDDGSTLPVNHIIYYLTHALPTHVPVVIILQSCQKSVDNSNDMAVRSSPESNNHIRLTRPHTLLLMSTVAGGTALRGAYTREIARQFSQADGKTSIQDMHCDAVQRMNGGYQWQVAESRCTLIRGRLLFPKPRCTSGQGQANSTSTESYEAES